MVCIFTTYFASAGAMPTHRGPQYVHLPTAQTQLSVMITKTKSSLCLPHWVSPPLSLSLTAHRKTCG